MNTSSPPSRMYMYAHTQFSGANPERLVAAIKYFLQGKGAEKGLRWEEGRKDMDGGGGGEGRMEGVEGGRRKDGGVGGGEEVWRGVRGGGRREKEGGKEVGSEKEVGDEGIDVASMNVFEKRTQWRGGGGETDQWRGGSERKNYREEECWGGGRRGW